MSAEFSDVECAVLGELTAQIVTLLEGGAQDDPAVRRLLPDAYREDREAAAEFRRLTASDLARRKIDAARSLVHTVGDGGVVTIDEEQGWQWLRSLTDLRLVLASRLGLDTEAPTPGADHGSDIGDDPHGSRATPADAAWSHDDPEREFLRNAFDWLGFVQETLVAAMEDRR